MKTQQQVTSKKALSLAKKGISTKLPNKLSKSLPRVTPKRSKSKGTLKNIPVIQYAKRQGKKIQIGV